MFEQTTEEVAIVGATGFLGKRLQRCLLDDGFDVLAPSSTDLNVVEEDDWRAFFSHSSPRCLFYLAAATPVRVAADPILAYEINVASITHLLRYVPDACRIVYTSSVHVYGQPMYLPMDERHPTTPNTPYGQHKQLAEQALLQSGRDCVVARLFHCLDLHDPPTGSFLHDWLQQRPPIAVGNVQVERDFVHVTDACNALRLLAQSGRSGQIYNVCSGRSMPLTAILDHLALPYHVDRQLFREGDHKRLVGCNQKLLDLSWQPKQTLFAK